MGVKGSPTRKGNGVAMSTDEILKFKLSLEGIPSALMPDEYSSSDGIDNLNDLVLCRDAEGEPHAVYHQVKWSFIPYDPVNKPVINFDMLVGRKALDEEQKQALEVWIAETKYILFLLMYYRQTGHTGRMTIGTLYLYYRLLSHMSCFCLKMISDNPFVTSLSLRDVFSSKMWIAKYLMQPDIPEWRIRLLRGLLSHLETIGENKTGIGIPKGVREDIEVDSEEKTVNQHPPIPPDIYVALLNRFDDSMDLIEPHIKKLEKFIARFSDPFYGRTEETQERHSRDILDFHYRPTFPEALSKYRLVGFAKTFDINSVRDLTMWLHKVQALLKMTIHIYTGMRDKEALRIEYNCVEQEEITSERKGDDGVVVEARMIDVISTTTKFTGYRKVSRWLLPEEALRAVTIVKGIARGLSAVCGVNYSEQKIFISPTVITHSAQRGQVAYPNLRKRHISHWISDITITDKDVSLLSAIDGSRDWMDDPMFGVGEIWPLTSHQGRRSLAMYGSNSGLVKLPTLRRQYHHVCAGMSRYYTNGFDKITQVFGVYDEDTGEYVLPDHHIIHEVQTAIHVAKAGQLMNELILGDESLFGKRGGYIERLRADTPDDEVFIIEVRAETERKVAAGEMTYRENLVGGCVGLTPCDDYVLGDVSAGHCLTCPDSSTKMSKVEALIVEIKQDMKKFEKDSGEYKSLAAELRTLEDYREYKINRRETFNGG